MKTYLNPKDRGANELIPEVKEETAREKYTVKELKEMCKEKGLSGYSKLKEAELIELLGL